MKYFPFILFLTIVSSTQAQNVTKDIKEKDVERIIKTLAADDMLGRSAKKPDQIEKAATFIESEFKSIHLQPLKGLTSFRQEFQKDFISLKQLEVTLDGQKIGNENIVLISEKADININNNLAVKNISFDATLDNKDKYFYEQAMPIYQDTLSAIVFVAPEFQSAFQEFKGYFGERFASKRKSTKIFVLAPAASTYTVRAAQQIVSYKMTNITGMLEGKTKPDEMVIFSGHYDHLGIQDVAIDGDSIANGADDDASGTTAVIELARYFKKAKNNNRTLVFVAFTAEEIGGYGSKYFSEQLDPDKVITMFNIEMIGKASKWGQNSAFMTGIERSDLGAIIEKNLKGTPFKIYPDPYPEQDLFYRSDNATLARLGVPAHSFSTDQIDSDKLYHTVNDETESLDVKNITATIRAIALAAESIISGKDTPARIDKSTVR
ncbi:MAG TPA: M20/M25/M40 family metallo-hydrolase [Cyclobacteriaceae bacterium]|nr:M20/M25/M40 family metallo-hydrolase [Cyclobacteriaceae bacterium]